MTDTKRLRELVKEEVAWVEDPEAQEFAALILAACDELEMLRENAETSAVALNVLARPPIEELDAKLDTYGMASWRFIFDAWPSVSWYIKRLEDEIATTRRSIQWRPMSEAPRDGTMIIAEAACGIVALVACTPRTIAERWFPLPPIPTKDPDHG